MPNSDAPLPSEESASSTVREFVYLDEAKIFSYLAQIEGGLRILRQEVESALDTASTESGGDKKAGSHNVEAQLSPTAAALAQVLTSFVTASISSGLLAGAGGKYTYQRSWENSTDVLKSETKDFSSGTDLSILHHAAFDLVVNNLDKKLVTVKGKLSILPLDVIATLADMSQGASSTQKSFVAETTKMFRDMGLSNICYIENKSENVNAFLNGNHFLVSPSEIFTTYGSPSQVDFTLVGIFAQDPGRTHKRTAPVQVSGDSKKLFESVNQSFERMWDVFGVKGGRRVYPLAIYLDL